MFSQSFMVDVLIYHYILGVCSHFLVTCETEFVDVQLAYIISGACQYGFNKPKLWYYNIYYGIELIYVTCVADKVTLHLSFNYIGVYTIQLTNKWNFTLLIYDFLKCLIME